ncbi:MAG: hypothetical protein Q7S00_04980 [bacterium]|nr:hypothetical protein [bacterium]
MFMSFQAHSAFALTLLSLVAGFWLLSKAKAGECACNKTGKIFGGLVILLSLLSLLCLSYMMVKNCCQKPMPQGWRHPPIEEPVQK